MSKNIIRLNMASRQQQASVIEALSDEREALLSELRDIKRVLAMVLSVHGPTQLPNALLVSFDVERTDIVEERVEAGFRYSLDQWGQNTASSVQAAEGESE